MTGVQTCALPISSNLIYDFADRWFPSHDIKKEIKKGIFVAVIPNNPELGKPSIREIINHIRGHVLLVVKDSFETVPELVNNVIAEVNSFLEKDVNIIGVIVNRCEKEQSEVQKLINKEIKKGTLVS